jgi:hypothetical protein
MIMGRRATSLHSLLHLMNFMGHRLNLHFNILFYPSQITEAERVEETFMKMR